MHDEHSTEFNEEEFQEYFNATDLNHDGQLSWEEWSTKARQQALDADYFTESEEEPHD